jgi:ribonuclease R
LAKSSNTPPEIITAAQVRDALAQGGLRWRALVTAMEAESSRRRGQLRLVVKGMVRNHELFSDHSGNYCLAAQDRRTGLLTSTRAGLSLDGVPLAPARGQSLRPGDEVEAEIRDGTAFVLEVRTYSSEPVVGELVVDGRFAHVEAMGPSYKGRVSLSEPPAVGATGDTVQVRITDQDRKGLVGMVTALVSQGGGAAHAAETLLASFDVPVDWPDGVEKAASKLPKSVDAKGFTQRRDLRDTPLVTIDGSTAKDFDDAVYAERVGKGWRILVAIADVGHYVKWGSALDNNAWDRGNSVYLPDRVIPMLPEALSNGLCSLRPQENRLALVCEMRISENGRVSRYDFFEALIYSHARLTYEQVWDYLSTDDASKLGQPAAGGEYADNVLSSLQQLHKAYDAMREEREERGALDFATREAVIELEGDQVVGVQPVQRNDAHKLIEECMIAANVCAARFLENSEVMGLYRNHEPPSVLKTEQLHEALAFSGVRLPKGELTPHMLQTALAEFESHPNRWIFESLVLRSLSQAQYGRPNHGHFGLALTRYMHFTSPIRRYADLVVHRAIKAVLNDKLDTLPSADWLDETGEHLCISERRADEVSWGVDGWLKSQYMTSQIGESLDGVIVAVTEFGVFVELLDFYVQGLVHISELGKDYYSFQASSMSLVGEKSGKTFGLGDALKVQVVSTQPARGRINLVPVDNKSDKKSDKKSDNKRSNKKGGSNNSNNSGKKSADSPKGRGPKKAKKPSKGKRQGR